MKRPAGSRAASGRLTVAVTAPRAWRPAVRGLASWLQRAAPAAARGQVDVAVMADGAIRRLNVRFRGVDAPTDVLSFPAAQARQTMRPLTVRRWADKSFKTGHLGDIAIAGGVARRQAAAYGHAVGTEMRLLALHGLLHLLGYDHERDQGQMQRLEARLRRRMNLPAGLLSRTPDSRPRR